MKHSLFTVSILLGLSAPAFANKPNKGQAHTSDRSIRPPSGVLIMWTLGVCALLAQALPVVRRAALSAALADLRVSH